MRRLSVSDLISTAREHLGDPMRRNSYFLIIGTGLTTGLGLLFWVITARLLSPEAVGTGASVVSVMTFLGTVSTLGLRNGLVRFLAAAGPAARRLVITSYALCGTAAMTAATVFVIGQPWWADQLGLLRANAWAPVVFIVGTGVWVIFVLQDQVLTGLRRAGWVPIANGVHSVLKIVVVALASFSAGWAIFAAVSIPAALVTVVVSVLIFRYLGQLRREPAPEQSFGVRDLVRFAISDHFSALLWLATTELLTLVVLQVAGAEASAYYFMAFMVGYSLYLITSNVGSALVAEAARYPERSAELVRQALRNAARLVVPLALAGALAAPLLLRLIGRDYAEQGTALLRLLILSAIPQIIVGIALSAARIRRDNKMIVTVYACIAVAVFGGTLLSLERWGLTAVGLVWLLTQLLVAAGLIAAGKSGLTFVDGRTAAVQSLGEIRRSARSALHSRQIRRSVDAALEALALPRSPGSYSMMTSQNDALVVRVESAAGPVVVKIATSDAASRGLDRHASVLTQLAEIPPAQPVRALFPLLLERRQVGGHTVTVETTLPGDVLPRLSGGQSAVEAAALAIGQLHAATASHTVVGPTLLAEWVDQPIASLRRLQGLSAAERSALDLLRETLYAALSGRELTTAMTHGDYWLGNLLMETSGGTPQVSGMIDWENGRSNGLPDADLVHLWLNAQPPELGAVVKSALESPLTASDLPLPLPNPELGLTEVILLTWLWHVSDGIERATSNSLGRIWVARNVKPVLRAMDARGQSRAQVNGMA